MNIENNPIIIKNKNFNSILIKICFPIKTIINEIMLGEFLPNLIIRTSKKYPDEESFTKAKISRYISEFGYSHKQFSEMTFIHFNMLIPDPKILKEDILKPAISFMMDTIYKSNVKNNEFDNEFFHQEKIRFKQIKMKERNDISSYTREKTYCEIDNLGFLIDKSFSNPELIDQITNNQLYDYYQTNILNNSPIIFIMGNVNTNEIKAIFKQYKLNDVKFLPQYNAFLSLPTKIKKIEEKSHFNQSMLTVVFKVNNIQQEDFFILQVIRNLLSNPASNILLEFLRKQKGLVYTAKTIAKPRSGILIIQALINKDSKDAAIKQINQAIEKLSDKEYIMPLLNNLTNKSYYNILRNLDSKFAVLNNQVNNILKTNYTDEEEYELYKRITFKDINKVVQKLEKSLIYFLKGDK